MSKRFVIGGGISAMAFAYYNRNVTLIDSSKNIVDSPFVFIHENRCTDKLLYDLGLEKEVINVLIKPKQADSVLRRKVGAGKDDMDYAGTLRISGIGPGNFLKAYNLSESSLCERLREEIKDQIIYGNLVGINETNIILEDKILPYDEIISTMHFLGFQKLYPSWLPGDKIKTMDVSAVEEPYTGKVSSIEYLTGDVIRIFHNAGVKKIGKEYASPEVAPEGAKLHKDIRFHGQIAPPPEKVLFVGRFANANPHWLLEDSIFVAQEGYIWLKMLTEQRRFDYAITSVHPNIGFEARIHNLLLHLHSEISELLRETNYKTHIHEKSVVKSSSILEEGIDIIKLTMAILNMFNYTEREIYEMFKDKSSRIWKKFLDSFYGGV